MIRTVESTLAGIILVALLVSLFSARPVPEIDPLPAYDLLLSLDLTGGLRQDALSYDSRAVWQSVTPYLPTYSCRIVIIGEGESSFGPEPRSPSATASYFIGSPEPREVRVTLW